MDDIVRVNDTWVKCHTCPKLLPEVEAVHGRWCRECFPREKRLADKEIIKAQQKALTKASTKLATALSKCADTAAVSPRIFEAFYDAIGGVDEYGRMLAKDFQKARGVGLTPEEQEDYAFNSSTLARWHDILLRFRMKEDERTTTDISSVSPEDLEAIVRQVSLDMILECDDIREAVISAAVKKNPSIACQIAEKTKVLETEATTVEPVDDDTSDLEYE